MSNKYDKMTSEDFQRILEELVHASTTDLLMSLPGAYEVFSEHFNNEVLDQWETEQEQS
jgi:hypothetical protein